MAFRLTKQEHQGSTSREQAHCCCNPRLHLQWQGDEGQKKVNPHPFCDRGRPEEHLDTCKLIFWTVSYKTSLCLQDLSAFSIKWNTFLSPHSCHTYAQHPSTKEQLRDEATKAEKHLHHYHGRKTSPICVLGFTQVKWRNLVSDSPLWSLMDLKTKQLKTIKKK